ncbi:MAG: hypothetical protein CME31_11965 [Gimesia sp.]|uniref:Uncharacterized protein n=1 Tax=Gimesia maris TaxID=122 RepID=A0A3D3REL8_9PLAN|nr:hypothetical protein [Gimesia sp.]HCO27265.1 hypothetical protein [Gimesia maris]
MFFRTFRGSNKHFHRVPAVDWSDRNCSSRHNTHFILSQDRHSTADEKMEPILSKSHKTGIALFIVKR